VAMGDHRYLLKNGLSSHGTPCSIAAMAQTRSSKLLSRGVLLLFFTTILLLWATGPSFAGDTNSNKGLDLMYPVNPPIPVNPDTSFDGNALLSKLANNDNHPIETAEATIIKVYSAEDQGYRLRSYVVKWHDQEVIARDIYVSTDKKVGKTLKFTVSKTATRYKDQSFSILQFNVAPRQ